MSRSFDGARGVALGALVGCVALAGAVLPVPAALASNCHARCDSNYYLCNRGGASPGERACATSRSTCYMRCTFARKSYGAIAYSEVAQVDGASRNQGSRAQAEAQALRDCRTKAAGVVDCKVLVHFYDRCGALAIGARGAFGSDHAQGREAAAGKALAHCRPFGGNTCRIARVVCTP